MEATSAIGHLYLWPHPLGPPEQSRLTVSNIVYWSSLCSVQAMCKDVAPNIVPIRTHHQEEPPAHGAVDAFFLSRKNTSWPPRRSGRWSND